MLHVLDMSIVNHNLPRRKIDLVSNSCEVSLIFLEYVLESAAEFVLVLAPVLVELGIVPALQLRVIPEFSSLRCGCRVVRGQLTAILVPAELGVYLHLVAIHDPCRVASSCGEMWFKFKGDAPALAKRVSVH
jgi:hypothetical protein